MTVSDLKSIILLFYLVYVCACMCVAKKGMKGEEVTMSLSTKEMIEEPLEWPLTCGPPTDGGPLYFSGGIVRPVRDGYNDGKKDAQAVDEEGDSDVLRGPADQ